VKYLFDTNAVIYTLKGVAKPLSITSNILHDATLITSDEKILKKASAMGMRVINPLQ
jgi:hypothetical protein